MVLEVFEAGNVVEGAPAATLVVDVPSSRVVKLVVTVGISNSDAGSSKNLLSIVRKIYKIPNNFAIVMFFKINLSAINKKNWV